jgi:hypothetical protein
MHAGCQYNWLKFCINMTMVMLNMWILLQELHSEACVCELTSSFSPKICLLSECPRITHFTPISDIMAGLISPANKRTVNPANQNLSTSFSHMRGTDGLQVIYGL